MTEDTYQIGDAANAAGLSLRTVRYYEEVGLVTPSGRTEGGFRLYSDADVQRLSVIKRLKPLAFSLDELVELLRAWDGTRAGNLVAARELERFTAVAKERCHRIRAEADAAEATVAQLAADITRTQTTSE